MATFRNPQWVYDARSAEMQVAAGMFRPQLAPGPLPAGASPAAGVLVAATDKEFPVGTVFAWVPKPAGVFPEAVQAHWGARRPTITAQGGWFIVEGVAGGSAGTGGGTGGGGTSPPPAPAANTYDLPVPGQYGGGGGQTPPVRGGGAWPGPGGYDPETGLPWESVYRMDPATGLWVPIAGPVTQGGIVPTADGFAMAAQLGIQKRDLLWLWLAEDPSYPDGRWEKRWWGFRRLDVPAPGTSSVWMLDQSPWALAQDPEGVFMPVGLAGEMRFWGEGARQALSAELAAVIVEREDELRNFFKAPPVDNRPGSPMVVYQPDQPSGGGVTYRSAGGTTTPKAPPPAPAPR